MHVCMYVCMYACMHVCMYACMHVCMYACMHVCMYACMHVCMHACMHVCMYACMHVCMYACMHVCMYACMHVCMYACMHVCIYIQRVSLHAQGQGREPHLFILLLLLRQHNIPHLLISICRLADGIGQHLLAAGGWQIELAPLAFWHQLVPGRRQTPRNLRFWKSRLRKFAFFQPQMVARAAGAGRNAHASSQQCVLFDASTHVATAASTPVAQRPHNLNPKA